MSEERFWSWDPAWVSQNLQLIVLLALVLLLGLCLIVILRLALRGMRMRVEMEREFRTSQEQWQAEQLALHQAELQQWQAKHQADLSRWQEEHQRQLAQVREEQQEIAKREAEADKKVWMVAEEKRIRQDAVRKSRSTIAGKVTEQLVPYLPDFPYNPKDARFLGSPIDLVVFEGLDEGALERVVMIEIKTGNSQLSARERQLRDIVKAGQVEWREIRVAGEPEAQLTDSEEAPRA